MKKINILKNYIKISYQVILLCTNFFHIILAKIFNKTIYSFNLRNGLKIVVNGKIGKADLAMFSEIWYYNYYNPKGFEIKENDIVFDIGANNGYYTLFTSLKAKKVYAFEPLEKLYKKIEESIKVNNIQNIVLEKFGVSDEEKDVYFYESSLHNGCHSLYRRDETDKKITIKTINLEEYCKKHNISKIDLLKLDCEGAEYNIFESLSEDFLKNTILKISMEYHDDIIKEKTHKIIENILLKNNFKVIIENGFLYAINQN